MKSTSWPTLVAATSVCLAVFVSSASASQEACGRASWYDLTSRTASGERMDPAKLTAAHPNLRFGTRLKVTNARSGASVIVRINDRGPFVGNRVLDLSKAAARQIGMISTGVARVCYRVVS